MPKRLSRKCRKFVKPPLPRFVFFDRVPCLFSERQRFLFLALRTVTWRGGDASRPKAIARPATDCVPQGRFAPRPAGSRPARRRRFEAEGNCPSGYGLFGRASVYVLSTILTHRQNESNRMRQKKSGISLILVAFLLVGSLLSSGCATHSTFWAQMPGFSARSDEVPGLISPLERTKAIRLKGKKGQTAPEKEREILLGQLLQEYQESPDPNIRREVIEAIALIPHPSRILSIKEGLSDASAGVRRSACTMLAGLEKNKNCTPTDRDEILHALRSTMRSDNDKDVRILAMSLIAPIAKRLRQSDGESSEHYNRIIEELGGRLEDKVPSIRYQAMVSLQVATGLDYGVDIDKWIGYIEYREGNSKERPRERTWTEKIPQPKLPMFM